MSAAYNDRYHTVSHIDKMEVGKPHGEAKRWQMDAKATM